MINFAPVYLPLFDLLDCWDVVNSKTFSKKHKKEQNYWINLSKVDTVLVSGGRDSGKTFALSCWNILASVDYNHRVLYTRQTMSSTDNSITEALEQRMELLGVESEFSVANKIYKTKGKGKISITGQKTSVGTQTAKTKSLEDFSVFLTEEAEELEDFDKWKKTKRSLRADDVQCLAILVFNPPTKEHFLYKEFYEENGIQSGFNGVKDNTLFIHSTYKDNIEHIAKHNINEYDKLEVDYGKYSLLTNKERENVPFKLKRNFLEYKHSILGGFRDIAEGVIFENWEIGEFNENFPTATGLDFGSNDPNALIKISVDFDKKIIYVDEQFFGSAHISEIAKIIHNTVGSSALVVGDSASKGLIDNLFDGVMHEDSTFYTGVNIVGVVKHKYGSQGFVEWGISTMQGFKIIVTKESVNVHKALKNYAWHNKKANVPNHYMSDAVDSIRYAFCELYDVRNN